MLRTVFIGDIKSASEFFASLGLTNNTNINPADFYLELAQKPPPPHCFNEEESIATMTYNRLFLRSEYHARFEQELNETMMCDEQQPVAAQPAALTRLGIMFDYFMWYFFR